MKTGRRVGGGTYAIALSPATVSVIDGMCLRRLALSQNK